MSSDEGAQQIGVEDVAPSDGATGASAVAAPADGAHAAAAAPVTGAAGGAVTAAPDPATGAVAADADTGDGVTPVAVAVTVPVDQPAPAPMSPVIAAVVATWLILVALAAVIGLLSLWPLAQNVQTLTRQAATSGKPPTGLPHLNFWIARPALTDDVSILLLGMLAGILGSLVHTFTRLNTAASKAIKPGRRRREVLWFVTDPVQGGILALFVIGAVAAGLLSTGQSSAGAAISLFTVLVLGGVAGLFSKRMTARLSTLVTNLADPETRAAQQAAQQAAQTAKDAANAAQTAGAQAANAAQTAGSQPAQTAGAQAAPTAGSQAATAPTKGATS